MTIDLDLNKIMLGIRLAFQSQNMVVDWCRDKRISDTIKLSRSYKSLWDRFEPTFNTLSLQEKFEEINSNIFGNNLYEIQFNCALSNELFKEYESSEYIPIINRCLITLIILEIIKPEINKIKNKKLYLLYSALYSVVEAYIPGTDIKYVENNQQFNVIKGIISNHLKF